MPAHLTDEQLLFLDLNLEEARAIKALAVAEGIRLAETGLGTKGYYRAISNGDEKLARQRYYDDLLRSKL